MSKKLEDIQIQFQKRNVRKRGPTSSEHFNDTLDELAYDLAEFNNQWNNRLVPLIANLPDGTGGNDLDAYATALDGKTLYIDSRATASGLNITYYNSSNSRPNSIYEQFQGVYQELTDLQERLENEIGNFSLNASQINIIDSSSLYTATNVEAALAEVRTAVNNLSGIGSGALGQIAVFGNTGTVIGDAKFTWLTGASRLVVNGDIEANGFQKGNVLHATSRIRLDELSSSPGNEIGKGLIYTKNDQELYFKDSLGTETILTNIVSTLSGLTDVNANGAAQDQIIKFNGSTWELVIDVSGVTNHTLLTNIGVNTHTSVDNHLASGVLHFLEADINHTAIQNIGINTHSSIDNHLASGVLHFTESNIDHTAIQNIGTNTHTSIDNHLASGVLHYLEADIDHIAIQNIGTNTHADIDAHIAAGDGGGSVGPGGIGELAYFDTTSGITSIAGFVYSPSVSGINIANNYYFHPSGLGTNAIAIGNGAVATGDESLGIGIEAKATGPHSVHICGDKLVGSDGALAYAAIAIGFYATATGSESIGINGRAGGTDAIAINGAINGERSIAIGNNAGDKGAWTGTFSVAIGSDAKVGGGFAPTRTEQIAIGKSARANDADYTTAIGTVATASEDYAIALGWYSNVAHTNSVAIGKNATTTITNQLMLGASSDVLNIFSWGYHAMRELASAPSQVADYGLFYAKTDGKAYFKNDAGTEFDLTISGADGITDHTLLTNIGSNSHDDIDNHLASGHVNSFNSRTGSVVSIDGDYSLSGLSDTTTVILISGQNLQWNGTIWKNETPVAGVTDHTLLSNIGTNTHAEIDTTLSNFATHSGDTTIHFTEASIDHGSIAGLSDDDHTQYHNDTRGDARYYTESELDAGQLDNRYYTETEADTFHNGLDAKITASGVINGNTHDHSGGDGAQIDHTTLSNVGSNTHISIDNHLASGLLHFTETSIDHTTIQNIGTNTHAEIDSHIAAGDGAGVGPGVIGEIAYFDTTSGITSANATLVSDTTLLIPSGMSFYPSGIGVNAIAIGDTSVQGLSTGDYSIAILADSNVSNSNEALADYCVSIGTGIINGNAASVVIGKNCEAPGDNSISIGSNTNPNNYSDGSGNILIGYYASRSSVSANNLVAIGTSAEARQTGVAIGSGARALQNNGISIGLNSKLTFDGSSINSIAIGNDAEIWGTECIAIGSATRAYNNTANGIAIGNSAYLGTTSTGDCDNSIAIGNTAGIENSIQQSIAIGNSANVSASNSIAIGNSAAASNINSVAIGRSAATTVSGQIMFGSASYPLHLTLNEQVAPSTPSSGTGTLYPKTDGKLYFKNDAGTEFDLTISGIVGSSSLDITSVKTGNYNASINEVVRVDPTGGAFTVTLPTSSGISGQSLHIKNVTSSATTITVSGFGAGETIDGVTTIDMSLAREALQFVSFDGTWGIF